MEVRFPIKTRFPKDANAIFLSADNHSKALEMAEKFMSSKGRIANTTESVSSRLTFGQDSSSWRGYITTSSTEYLGLNENGKPVLAFLEGSGPLSSKEKLETAFSVCKKQKIGRISRIDFLDILKGKYGKVSILDFDIALSAERKTINKHSYMSLSEALSNELLLHRLGGYHSLENKINVNAYLSTHWSISRVEVEKKFRVRRPGDEGMIRCDLSLYHHKFAEFKEKEGEGYEFICNLQYEQAPFNLNEYATASFISLQGLVMNGNDDILVSEVGTSDPDCNCQFLVVYDEKAIYAKHSIPSYSANSYKRRISQLFIKQEESNVLYKHAQIASFNGWYFTLLDKCILEKGEEGMPSKLLLSMHIVGERKLYTEIIDEHRQTNELLDVESVKKSMKSDWDFFQVNQIKFEMRHGKKMAAWYITLYKGDVDTQRRIPTEEEILTNRFLLGRIA